MAKTFKIDEAILAKIGDGQYHICPECKAHKQSNDPTKYHDCKNVFIDETGQSVGQCMCYALEHGVREEK